METNIKPIYKNGVAVAYETQSTDTLKIPTMGFEREVDAELAVSIAKSLADRGNEDFMPILNGVKYVFRVLKLDDSAWVK